MILQAEWPEAFDSWLSLGAEPVEAPSPVGSRPVFMGCTHAGRHSSERSASPRTRQPGLTLRTGHVDGLVLEGGQVTGVRVDGSTVEADLVVDASGRAGRLGRPVAQGERCRPSGRLRPRVRRPHLPAARRSGARAPWPSPIAYVADFDGYQCLVFLHEAGHFSVVLVRPTADAALKELRFEAAFEAACRAIPALAEWTDPARALPTSSGAGRRGAAQRLPPTDRHTGTGGRRRLGRDDDPDPRA